MKNKKCKSLEDLFDEATSLSWECTYKNMRKDGTYYEVRDDLSGEEWDLIGPHADGLAWKAWNKIATGRCSLQASIDFDIQKFESRLITDISKMQILLARIGKPKICSDAHLLPVQCRKTI